MKKIILIILGLILMLGAAVGWYMYQKPVNTLESREATARFKSTELFRAFQESEAESTKAYRGKVLEVSGKLVQEIENSDGSSTLILDGGDPIFGIKCRLDPAVSNQRIPPKGEQVTLKGLLIGMNADVEMNQCIIL